MNRLKKWLKRKLREMLDVDEIDQGHIVGWCRQSEYELTKLHSEISDIHEELDEISNFAHYVSTGLTSSKMEIESNLSYIQDKLDSLSNTLDLKVDKHEIIELINSSDERINGGRIIIDGETLIEDGVFKDIQNER